MTELQTDREIQSGWKRTFVTTMAGVLSLAGSTYLVIDKIARVQIAVENNSKMLDMHNARITQLESARLPDGLARGELQATLRELRAYLERIDKRLDRIENDSNHRRQ